jgi:DNA-binding NtrC family response regulator
MGQAQQKRRAVLIVEDDAELRGLTAALLEDGELDTIECESAEAALAIMLIGGRDVAMIFADIRLPGVMDGLDLAREVKMRWPRLTVILTSGHPRERFGALPLGVDYMPKPWRPLNLLVAAEQALGEFIRRQGHALADQSKEVVQSIGQGEAPRNVFPSNLDRGEGTCLESAVDLLIPRPS